MVKTALSITMSMSRRPVTASAPSFGRRAQGFVLGHAQPPAASGFADDARLFAMTFVGGFLFMAVYLA